MANRAAFVAFAKKRNTSLAKCRRTVRRDRSRRGSCSPRVIRAVAVTGPVVTWNSVGHGVHERLAIVSKTGPPLEEERVIPIVPAAALAAVRHEEAPERVGRRCLPKTKPK